MINQIQTSATFVGKFFRVNQILLRTKGHTLVKNRLCVLLVARDLNLNRILLPTKGHTLVKNHLCVLLVAKDSQQKRL